MSSFTRLAMAMAMGIASTAHAEIHTTWEATQGSTESGLHNDAYGTITFDDWGFTGPDGRTATDFSSVNGFGNSNWDPNNPEYCINNPSACDIGQVQHVVTSGPDWQTPDDPHLVQDDLSASPTQYVNANVDSAATFYQWGYESPAGSTFNNMLIDFDGDYHIAKDDMSFAFYNTFEYQQVIPEGGTRVPGSPNDGTVINTLAFQPYALSDATGWCGSILADHPNAHEAMAGQVTFDFAFDVYFKVGENFYYSGTEIVRGFEMRSYGDIYVNVNTGGGELQEMSARAVINNTDPNLYRDEFGNPINPTVDENAPLGDADTWHNKVSFMGASVVPGYSGSGDCGMVTAEWAGGARGPGVKKFDSILEGVGDAAACSAAGGEWQTHAYSGYAFILRADAERFIDYFDESVYGPDPMAAPVPVPAAVWLFGSGLLGLIGVARRRT